MSQLFEIYALCYCEKFNFDALESTISDDSQYAIYQKVIQVEWKDGHIFLFDYGVIVFWNLQESLRKDFLKTVDIYAITPLAQLIEDVFTYEIQEGKCRIKNDHIFLPDDESAIMLALSHGIAQSTKLNQFELSVMQTIDNYSHIPRNIAHTGKSLLSRLDLEKLRGRLFLVRSDINLNYELLDTPEFFWNYPELDSYYFVVADYLEIKQRLEVLSKKLDTINALFDMIAEELRHKHSSQLEWIIIWLILVEIIIFLLHDMFGVI